MSEYKDIQFNIALAQPLDVTINANNMSLDFNITDGAGGKLPTYDGEYEVRPKPFLDQVLETKNKSMLDNVTVFEIPYSEVENPGGGKTVNIGFDL